MNSEPRKCWGIESGASRIAVVTLSLLMWCGAMWAGAVEHPGVLPPDVECASCHAAKVSGKSVHSVMETSCTVCHVAMTKGDMTLMSLSMPKEKICSACHEEAAALRQHVPRVKAACVECHDAHSSEQRMLLISQSKR